MQSRPDIVDAAEAPWRKLWFCALSINRIWIPVAACVASNPGKTACTRRPLGPSPKALPVRRMFAAQLPNTGRPVARSSGGRGLASPVVPGWTSLLAVLVSPRSKVITVTASSAIITAAPKSTTGILFSPFRLLLIRDPLCERESDLLKRYGPSLND